MYEETGRKEIATDKQRTLVRVDGVLHINQKSFRALSYEVHGCGPVQNIATDSDEAAMAIFLGI